jgi:bifunctional oligoribonuclease and PAP phosphatase NrnA
MIDFQLLEKIIRENNSFLLTTHVNPDADAIGSEVALYFILKELGKDVCIVNHSQTPYNLLFLDTDNRIEKYNPERHDNLFQTTDVLVALDFNRSDRMVSMAKAFNASDKLKICIDHHQDPENFAGYYFMDQGYSATGHILFDFIKKTQIVKLSYQTAYPIYAAIMTDTGSFRFDRTTPELHRTAAELLELNVDPSDVFDKIYDQSLFSKVKLLGKALDSLALFGEKKQIGYMVITREILAQTGALESDTDGFVNFSLSVEFVKIGLMFIELKEGFKISFRSKGMIPVHKLAAEFGGGGHTNAAGARSLKGNMNDFIPLVLNKAEQYLEYQGEII